MICPTCHFNYPGIACAACAERTSRAALLAQQPQFLERMRSGTLELKLARKPHGKPHVQLFGDENHAFCGEPLEHAHRTHTPYNQLLPDTLCTACARQMAELMGITVEAL